MKIVLISCLLSQISLLMASDKPCPENSWCPPQVKKAYQQFKTLLRAKDETRLKQFIQKKGLPIQFLTPKKEKYVFWNSRCSQHRKLYKGEAFLKKMKTSSSQIFPKANIGKNQFLIPYDLIPSFAEKEKLIFHMNFDESYFFISVDTKGKILYYSQGNDQFKAAKNYPCSKKEKEKTQKFFRYSICQEIWNKSSKRFEKIRLDWSCP